MVNLLKVTNEEVVLERIEVFLKQIPIVLS